MARRRGFGAIRRLPSKRFQASYVGPDLVRHAAPSTFEAREDAEAWLASERRKLEGDAWVSPAARQAAKEAGAELDRLTVEQFVNRHWLPSRELRPSTQRDYDALLRNHVLPWFGDKPVRDLTRGDIYAWWKRRGVGPRARSKAFQLLHTIYELAVFLDIVPSNPVALPPSDGRIRSKQAKAIFPLEVPEIEALADAMPPKLRMAVLLGCWCGLRYSELTELRRSDVDKNCEVLHVQRAVTKVAGGYVVGPPKTDAGIRTIHVPLDLQGELAEHLEAHAGWGAEGLLFPAANGGHLHSSSFARVFQHAAEAIDRPDATPHTMRHTHASIASALNAPPKVTMKRLGHTTAAMTMRYTHSLRDADEQLAERLSELRKASS